MNTILHPKIKMNIEEKAFQSKLYCIIFVSVIFHYSFIAFFSGKQPEIKKYPFNYTLSRFPSNSTFWLDLFAFSAPPFFPPSLCPPPIQTAGRVVL